ncbi:MAG: hypothetical protein J6A85_02840 [Clostridia bacterium]|nr:hypothetical protein [Clostridia bacterium]
MRYRHGAVTCGGRIYAFRGGYEQYSLGLYGAVPARLGAPRMAAFDDFVTFAQK